MRKSRKLSLQPNSSEGRGVRIGSSSCGHEGLSLQVGKGLQLKSPPLVSPNHPPSCAQSGKLPLPDPIVINLLLGLRKLASFDRAMWLWANVVS